jgi:hypothetical protein
MWTSIARSSRVELSAVHEDEVLHRSRSDTLNYSARAAPHLQKDGIKD